MKRAIFLILVLSLAGCATIGPPVTSKEVEEARKALKVKAFKFRVRKELELTRIGLKVLQNLPPEDIKKEYPYLGLSCRNINRFFRDVYDFNPQQRGVVLLGAVPGLPVSEGGLEEGDIIFKINGYKINDTSGLSSVVKRLKPGEEILLTIKRTGKEKIIKSKTIKVPYDIAFGVADIGSVNATAAPGRVLVTYGMLRFINSEDELAVVLAHEVAHLVKDHILRNMGSGILAGVGGVLLGAGAEVLAPGSGGTVSDISGGAFGAKFSRDLEREADYFGLKYAHLAGYDIDAGKDIWERFAVEAPRSMTRDLFSTHPSSPERMLRLKKIAEGIKKEKAEREGFNGEDFNNLSYPER
jgi:hypothetical protein